MQANVNVVTEAKVKVAINGFGRIGTWTTTTTSIDRSIDRSRRIRRMGDDARMTWLLG